MIQTPTIQTEIETTASEISDHSAPPTQKPTSTTRVLHVINGEHYAGAERVQDLLAAQLPNFGYKVGFACIKPGRFEQARTTKTAPLLEVPMRWRLDLRPAWKIAEMVNKGKYALIHSHTARSALIGAVAARLTGVPFVHHVHSPTAQDSTHRLRNLLNVLSEHLTIRRADRLIAVSPSLQDLLMEKDYPAEQVSYVPNGVPGVMFDADRQPPDGTWTLGMVALFRPRKGIEVLLESLANLRAAGDNVRLRAIGPFETQQYEHEVMTLVRRLDLDDAIDWTGFSEDVNAQLSQVDLLVLPSLFGEGLPMVVLEAMAAGVPVVATDIEGIPVAVRDGSDGVVIAPNDADALATGIARIVRGELDWKTLRNNAYRRHAEQFSDRAMAKGVAQIYSEVLS